MIKLSIIVPVYNVEKYLANCIDSILEQKLSSYEIVLVDDGSTDNSGDICDKYSNQYKEIITIHKENGGLSSARNAGIKKSKGEYLMFIDSDDFINSNEKINDIFPYLKYDIIQYKMIYFYDKTNKYVYLKDFTIYENISYIEQLKNKVKDAILSISACDKIIKRNLIVDNGLFFEEGLLSEDVDWSLRLYLKAKSLVSVNKNIYVYRQQRKGSISTTAKIKNINSLYSIIKKWYEYNYDNDEQKQIYFNYLAYQYSILICIINKKNCPNKLKKEIYSMREILKYNDNYKVKITYKAISILGIHIGTYFLKTYLFLKNKGLLKL